jgi:hypothetical protein
VPRAKRESFAIDPNSNIPSKIQPIRLSSAFTLLNCLVFRHAVDKKTLMPIHPHTPKAECEKLLRAEKIFGCGGALKLKFDRATRQWIGEICEY